MDRIDILWVLVSALLVFTMQAGFLCLESGFVRAKNSINVAMKNVADFCVAGLLFWAAGYAIAFGPGAGGLIGLGDLPFASLEPEAIVVFLFQMMFCGTATTIVSGAVAERMRYGGYIATSALVSLLVYPVYAHWAWNGGVGEAPAGWLAALGFIDFAGSTVVHSIGGWAALAAVLVVGARAGRFEGGGRLHASSLSLSALGVLLLFLGWFGFNGGSLMRLDDRLAMVLLNTVLGGAAGGLGAHLLAYAATRRVPVESLLNGVIAGLVAITAGCHLFSPGLSVLVGLGGGAVAVAGARLLEHWRIDDAVQAIPAHLFAGIWGTLAVALAAEAPLRQLGLQALGMAAAGIYGFGLTFLALRLIDRHFALRVGRDAELMGLNIAEHGAGSDTFDLLAAMEQHRLGGDFARPLKFRQDSELAPVAVQYNRVLDRVNLEAARREQAIADLRRAKHDAEAASRAKDAFLANMSHELRTPLNAVIGFAELVEQEPFGPIGNAKYKTYVHDIRESGAHLLSLVNDLLDMSRIEAGQYRLSESILDLRQVAQTAARMLAEKAQAGGLIVALDLPEHPLLMRGDQRALRQIALNLVTNAVKFTLPGGRVTICVRLEDDRRPAFAVIDTGIGMRHADIPRALEPFVQLHESHDRAQGGTGLGLSLTLALVKMHGGTLTIQSAPEKGTTVTARFPFERLADPD
ncbi:MAG: hypothetical protein OHK0024_25650 [Thalassobaculales bacterium]